MLRAFLAGALLSVPAVAGDLVFPVDCTLGETCVIQQYVDRNPGPGIADFTCGQLTYDGHRGTDIRLPDIAAMDRGVDVLAAAPGRVVGTRDGLADIRQGAARAPDISGKECGNGVLIKRADGWRFQYCHLKNGSVAVRKGQVVDAGDRLGQVGLSGKTQFPHLHLTIRDQAGRVIDPFDTRQQNEACSLKDRRSLWRTLSPTSYQPGGPLSAGFADAVPEYEAVRAGTGARASMPTSSDAIVFWAHFFGLRKGDEVHLTLYDPKGAVLAEDIHRMNRNRATQFRAVGRRAQQAWPLGTYKGEADLIRNGSRIDRISAEVIIH
ncbi:MAG: M23 family metallopeptidase [Paracoccaceae bacterium]